MPGNMRVIRWAEEVTTPTGVVDVIRFEDYKENARYFCRYRETPWHDSDCKYADGVVPPIKDKCHGCVYRGHVYETGIWTTCYEVKVSVADFKSKNGHNFHGNSNYYAVPIDIADRVMGVAQFGVGVIAYYPKSKRMAIKRECELRELSSEDTMRLLYDAMKKWVDGKQETSRAHI